MNNCAFCGPTKAEMSPEDVWPHWLSTALRRRGVRNFRHVERNPISGTEDVVLGQRLKFRVPVVCKPCNTGWMSQAEQAVKNILLSLATDADSYRRLTLVDRHALAFWASIKSVVLDHQNVQKYGLFPPFFTPQQRAAMKRDKTPPTRTEVYVAKVKSPQDEHRGDFTTLYFSDFPGKPYKHLRAFAVTISINHFIIQLIASKMTSRVPLVPVPFSYNMLGYSDWTHFAPLIWPNSTDVLWPPMRTIRRFDTLAYRLGQRPGD